MARIYLLEREAGFSTEGIGFPSIFGCIAIVYRTTRGVFGFHNAGGSSEAQFEVRGAEFAQYVASHPQGKDAVGTHLYGITFVQRERGYALHQQRRMWAREVDMFGRCLAYFDGPISGVDLTDTGWKRSAYVDFSVARDRCDIGIKVWNDADKTTGRNPGDNTRQKSLIGSNLGTIVTDVTRDGLIQKVPEPLRPPPQPVHDTMPVPRSRFRFFRRRR